MRVVDQSDGPVLKQHMVLVPSAKRIPFFAMIPLRR